MYALSKFFTEVFLLSFLLDFAEDIGMKKGQASKILSELMETGEEENMTYSAVKEEIRNMVKEVNGQQSIVRFFFLDISFYCGLLMMLSAVTFSLFSIVSLANTFSVFF